jgi:hypothetical protein
MPGKRPFELCVSLLFPVAIAAGCGSQYDGPERAAVSGAVTIYGQAVDWGAISFVPTDGNRGPVAGGEIKAGKYRLEKAKGPIVGKNRVEIYGSRKTGRKVRTPTGETVDEFVPLVPEQYNTSSTLVRDISAGDHWFDFGLTAK